MLTQACSNERERSSSLGGGQARPNRSPWRRLFVSVRRLENRCLVKRLAGELKGKRQSGLLGIAATHRHGGAAGHVKRHRQRWALENGELADRIDGGGFARRRRGDDEIKIGHRRR